MVQQPKEECVVEIIVNGTKANASLKEMAAAAVLSNQVAKIAADDPRRAELIGQLQQMRQRLTDIRSEVNGLVQSQEQLAAAQAATVAEQARAIAAGQQQSASLVEMRTAAGLLSFGLNLLGQDAKARKKHHSLYTALAAAKVIVDGTKEVARIWEYSADNPANGPTLGAAGIIMGGIQTGVAIARTAVALGQLRGVGSGGATTRATPRAGPPARAPG